MQPGQRRKAKKIKKLWRKIRYDFAENFFKQNPLFVKLTNEAYHELQHGTVITEPLQLPEN